MHCEYQGRARYPDQSLACGSDDLHSNPLSLSLLSDRLPQPLPPPLPWEWPSSYSLAQYHASLGPCQPKELRKCVCELGLKLNSSKSSSRKNKKEKKEVYGYILLLTMNIAPMQRTGLSQDSRIWQQEKIDLRWGDPGPVRFVPGHPMGNSQGQCHVMAWISVPGG